MAVVTAAPFSAPVTCAWWAVLSRCLSTDAAVAESFIQLNSRQSLGWELLLNLCVNRLIGWKWAWQAHHQEGEGRHLQPRNLDFCGVSVRGFIESGGRDSVAEAAKQGLATTQEASRCTSACIITVDVGLDPEYGCSVSGREQYIVYLFCSLIAWRFQSVGSLLMSQ